MKGLSFLWKKYYKKQYETSIRDHKISYHEWLKEEDSKEYEAEFLYGDYELDGVPIFLPAFSPHRLWAEDYLGPAVYVKESMWEETTNRRLWMMECLQKGARISHISSIQAKANTQEEGQQITWHKDIPGYRLLEKKEDYPLESKLIPKSLSIVIPSKDHFELLSTCIHSVLNTTKEERNRLDFLEFIIVDNGSSELVRKEIEQLCIDVEKEEKQKLSCAYLYQAMEFHFSKMCNWGSEKAKGEYLLFLNDDIQAVEEGWLLEMLQQFQVEHTGAVGMKLLYPDGKRIQHAGITNLPMGPVHKLQFHEDGKPYYDHRNRGIHNVSAVTGACLMIKSSVYKSLGGMNENLPVAFNDVELCFHALEKAYQNVVCCNHHLIHHESVSRGQDDSVEKRSRLLREREKLYQIHPKMQGQDAYYPYQIGSYGLNARYLDTKIEPAYVEGRNKQQEIRSFMSGKELEKSKQQTEAHASLNHCLQAVVEQVYTEQSELILVGYVVVLGSDNSLFEASLYLQGSENSYGMKLDKSYRYDLLEQLQDQKNVGMSGFEIRIPKENLAKDTYQVVLMAKDLCSSLKLRKETNVIVNL